MKSGIHLIPRRVSNVDILTTKLKREFFDRLILDSLSKGQSND